MCIGSLRNPIVIGLFFDIFLKKILHWRTKYRKYIFDVFSRTQPNGWKCFPFYKIFSTENMLHSEIILYVAKHSLVYNKNSVSYGSCYINRHLPPQQ